MNCHKLDILYNRDLVKNSNNNNNQNRSSRAPFHHKYITPISLGVTVSLTSKGMH